MKTPNQYQRILKKLWKMTWVWKSNDLDKEYYIKQLETINQYIAKRLREDKK